MKRRTAHYTFAAIALWCAALAMYYGVRLLNSMRVDRAIAAASASQADEAIPEARFARALAFIQVGDLQSAVKDYQALTNTEHGELRRRALYNLGNLYLREALADGPERAFRSLPLLELAKQSYRAVLRDAPHDWDARYNLERALWLAPERDEEVPEEEEPPDQEQTISTLPGARIDLP